MMTESKNAHVNNTTKSTERARKRRKSHRRKWIIFFSLIFTVAAGYAYYQFLYLPQQESVGKAEAQMQTATIRQGDIVLYTRGVGELIAESKITITVPVNEKITAVNYSIGDSVEAGDVLMTLDKTNLIEKYDDAVRAFNEFKSPASIAYAKQQVAAYEDAVREAENSLIYLISYQTYYWEEQLAEAQTKLEKAEAEGNQETIEEAKTSKKVAENNLYWAHQNYKDNYVPENFTYEECEGSGRNQTCEEYISAPSEKTIQKARTTLELNQALLFEAQDYLTLISTGSVSSEATGSGISGYYNLLKAMETAKENLEAAEMIAPISGVITELSGNAGEQSSANTFVTINNTENLYMKIYLDSSDWDKIDLGYEVEVTFDSLPEETFIGSVTQIDPFVSSSGGANIIGGLVALKAEDISFVQKMPLGSSAAVEVIRGRAENAMLVPIEALKNISEDQYGVFVLRDGEPMLTIVEIGLKDIYYAEVISGLNAGDVVTTGIVETE